MIFYNTYQAYKPIKELVDHLTKKQEQMIIELDQTMKLIETLKEELEDLNKKSKLKTQIFEDLNHKV